MSKNGGVFIILLEIIAFVSLIISIISAINDKDDLPNKVKYDFINEIDTIPKDSNGVIRKYNPTIKRITPDHLDIFINTKESFIKLNSSKIKLGTSIDQVFNITGNPNRSKKTVLVHSFVRTCYLIDSFGFYLFTDINREVKGFTFYFSKDEFGFIPGSINKRRLFIDGIEVVTSAKTEELVKNLGLNNYLIVKDYYVKEAAHMNLLFNFASPDKHLVNVMVEEKMGSQ